MGAIKHTISKLPTEEGWVICGDWNAHHENWDNIVPRDSRGKQMAKWIEDNNMFILNDGNITRHERGTNRKSTPDITICHAAKTNMMTWKTEQLMGSDHVPIFINVGIETPIKQSRSTMAWQWKNARWSDYKEEITTDCNGWKYEESVTIQEKNFRKIILKAAYANIGIKPIRTRNGEVLNQGIKNHIERRNEIMKADVVDWEKVTEEETAIKVKTNEVKTCLWKRKIEQNSSHEKMWGILKSLKNTKTPNEKDKVLVYRGKGRCSKRSKATAFACEYAAVSSLNIPVSNRNK